MLNKLSDKLLWIGGVFLMLALLFIGWQQNSLPMTTTAGTVLGLLLGLLTAWQYIDRRIVTPDESKLEAARRARRDKRKNGR